jgi:glutathione peroxidase
MKKIIDSLKYLALMLLGPKKSSVRPANNTSTKNLYDFTLKSIEGKEIDFNAYKGKKVLIVNTASECGYTPQYSALEELHQKHQDKLVVLGFPADNFGGQEPGDNEHIATFCQRNFGVTFQLFQKSDVIGENQNLLYQWLTNKELNGWNKIAPSWNFCKYLVGENGELLKVYTPSVAPLSDELIKDLSMPASEFKRS